jgi:hypothetical protein
MVFNNPDWLGYPEYRRVEFIDPEEGKCPVCGAENGSCKGDSTLDHMIEFLPKKKDDPMATFSVPERVYTEEQVGSKLIRKLLYSPGDRITVAEAKRVGLLG